jgi:hypothetical protein
MSLIRNPKLQPAIRLERPRAPRRFASVAGPAQIIRALIVGFMLGIVFLWALPRSHILFANWLDPILSLSA